MDVDADDGRAAPTCGDYVERTFRPVAEQKGLAFEIELADGRCPPTS